MQVIQSIQNRIYDVRGERVMIDKDLAALYEVETKVLNQAVKRNFKRFPPDFMFQLTLSEWELLRPQVELNEQNMRSQFVTASLNQRNINALPYVFTEHGIAMLSGILHSDRAINMNIAIMRAFVDMRRIVLQENNLGEQLKQLKDKLGVHDAQLNQIYDALENMMDEKAAARKWESRDRIGFKSQQ